MARLWTLTESPTPSSGFDCKGAVARTEDPSSHTFSGVAILRLEFIMEA